MPAFRGVDARNTQEDYAEHIGPCCIDKQPLEYGSLGVLVAAIRSARHGSRGLCHRCGDTLKPQARCRRPLSAHWSAARMRPGSPTAFTRYRLCVHCAESAKVTSILAMKFGKDDVFVCINGRSMQEPCLRAGAAEGLAFWRHFLRLLSRPPRECLICCNLCRSAEVFLMKQSAESNS